MAMAETTPYQMDAGLQEKGCFYKITISSTAGLPNFGVFLEDYQDGRSNRDPTLAKDAILAMREAIKSLEWCLQSGRLP